MQKYIVEFLGTLFLMVVILYTGNYLAVGITIAILVFLGGPISGGAFNPAVTLAFLASKKISTYDVLPYIIAQIAGALTAVYLVKLLK